MTLVDIAVALVRTTLVTSLAALVAWALLAALRVRSPRIHRVAWLLVIAQGWLFFPFTIQIESPAPSPSRRAAGLVPAVIAEVAVEAIPLENETEWARGPFATSDSPTVEAPLSQKVPDPLLLAIAAWLLGAGVIVIIAAYRYLRVLRTLPLGSPLDNPQWQAEWEAAYRSAKLRRRHIVTLRITAALGPLLHWAPWAYFILVPRPLWSSLAAAERSAILRHELAHLRRNDLWKSLAIRVLALPQWFNPLVWFAIRRFDEAAEWACDDAAARHADDRLAFANSLLQSAEYALAPYPASAPAARGTLTRRIHRLVSPRFKEESKMKLLLVPTLLLLAAAAQTIRIERVVAEAPLEVAPQPTALGAQRHPELPLSAAQTNFDQLTEEFASFAQAKYVIEPPDILSIRIDPKIEASTERSGTFGRVVNPRIRVAEIMDAGPKRVLVEGDGKILVSPYTSVYVAGMTLDEAEHAIKSAIDGRGIGSDVEVSVDQFNSKVYYVITEGAAQGDDVTRAPIPYPIDGKETIGVAIARVYGDPKDLANPKGLMANAMISLHRVDPQAPNSSRVYAIEWDPALQAPTPLTNHCVLPGDRIFIRSKEAVERRTLLSPQAAPSPPQVVNPQALPHSAGYYQPTSAGSRPYVIETPDVVSIEAIKLTPKKAYRLQPHDVVMLQAEGTKAGEPIIGNYAINAAGQVKLGPTYGGVAVAGATLEEAKRRIHDRLAESIKNPNVAMAITTVAIAQTLTSQYLVDADGEIALGNYGAVRLHGLTMQEAREAIERKISGDFDAPQVLVNVAATHSKGFFVVLENGEENKVMVRRPVTGNERVIDAVAAIGGMPPQPLERMWIDRPAYGDEPAQVLEVDWDKISRGAETNSNHQLLPNDSLHIALKAEPLETSPKILPSPILPGQEAAPPADLTSGAPDAVALTFAVIEDANDSLAEFRAGKSKGDLIAADSKTFGAALRVLEKNSLIQIVDRERIACSLGDGDRHDAELPLPNPTLRLKPTQTEPTQVSVRRLGKDGYAVKLEFRRTVDGNEDYQAIELAMRLGGVDVFECTGATADSASDAKSYLVIQLAAEGDKSVSVEPSPAAAPKSESLVEGQPTLQFMLERRFVPTLRNPKKPKPPTEKSTYLLQPYDTIKLHVVRPHPPAYVLNWGDVQGEFTLARDGSIRFGGNLESVHLAGMTSAEACRAIEEQLRFVAPECKATLEFGPLASEKFFVSVQHPDGTEIAAGAMAVDSSNPASLSLGSLRHWLGTAFEAADWELAEPSDSGGRKAYLPGPGDRLVVKVRADAELGLLEYPPSRPGYRVIAPAPQWLEVFGTKAKRGAYREPYLIL